MSVTVPPRRTADPSMPVPADEGLFRREVIAERQTQWLGTVLIAPRISYSLVSLLAVLAAAGVLALLFFGGYTRKVRINGWLVPQAGLVRLFAPQSGVVVQQYAREGMEVAKGKPLLVLSTEIQSETLGATRGEVVRRLQSRRDSLAVGRERQQQLYARQAEDLTKRIAALQDAQTHFEGQLRLQRARMALSQQAMERQSLLYAGRLTPVDRLEQAEGDQLQQAANQQSLLREQGALQRERLGLEAELQQLPLKEAAELAETDRSIAALEQELAEAEARREIVLVAPQDGIVTAIAVEPGGGVNTATPLLSIVPAHSELQAQLFGPSRAMGFVRPGQRVTLRYEAFPYQKFGHAEGVVASISRSAISPAELPQQLSGLTSLYGANAPVYRITVILARQTVNAYGEAMPLQPGMQLEADVLTERRRLIEWVLEPLFTLTGSWRR